MIFFFFLLLVVSLDNSKHTIDLSDYNNFTKKAKMGYFDAYAFMNTLVDAEEIC